jgi:hypothetical protein
VVFKVGDKVKINLDYQIIDTKQFSHNVIYKVLAPKGTLGLTLEGIYGDNYGEMFFELAEKSVGFVIE